ncbi:MAG: hypothetical protein E7545_08745 [Ruminococcaceae bacterium]|nr:hypothetical protein [Oscillospiraceae bacterium]
MSTNYSLHLIRQASPATFPHWGRLGLYNNSELRITHSELGVSPLNYILNKNALEELFFQCIF